MTCERCGTDKAAVVRYDGSGVVGCDICANVPITSVPDAFFKEPYFDSNLANDKHPNGMVIRSKGHKKQVMKQLGVREGGDVVRGKRTKFDHRIVSGGNHAV